MIITEKLVPADLQEHLWEFAVRISAAEVVLRILITLLTNHEFVLDFLHTILYI